MYVPNPKHIKASNIENIIQQLPSKFLLVGDFNSHSLSWRCDKPDYRGQVFEKIIQMDNITLFV